MRGSFRPGVLTLPRSAFRSPLKSAKTQTVSPVRDTAHDAATQGESRVADQAEDVNSTANHSRSAKRRHLEYTYFKMDVRIISGRLKSYAEPKAVCWRTVP